MIPTVDCPIQKMYVGSGGFASWKVPHPAKRVLGFCAISIDTVEFVKRGSGLPGKGVNHPYLIHIREPRLIVAANSGMQGTGNPFWCL